MVSLGILYGGPTSEREVSFATKDYFYKLYKNYQPNLIEWQIDFNFKLGDKEISIEQLISWLKRYKILVIISSHGEYVEDGYLQKIFENNKISFTGSNSKASHLSINKFGSYNKVRKIVKTIPTYKIKPNQFDYQKMTEILGHKFPIFIKPNNLGSSVGAYKIDNKNNLLDIIDKLNNIDYLFQPFIEGLEVSLGSVREGTGFMKLFPTEIKPKNKFFDYQAKYEDGKSEEITPARLPLSLIRELREITNKIHQVLGLGYYSRSDFIIDKNLNIYYLETNSLPGMTKTSLLPQQLTFSHKLGDFKKDLIKNVIQAE